MKSLADFKFEVDSSNIRSKLREARVMSEEDSLDHLHLFDYTNTDQRNRIPKKYIPLNSATALLKPA
jgi:RHH-type proline utilization regulon transcriptional repressor/proline dehydrogenase/delta 1-pyrroline-5-carboxylate dehydrogenase